MHIVLGLLIAFGIVAYFAWRDMATRACRWRKDSTRDVGGQHFFRCAACGAEALTDTDEPPRKCLAKLPEERL